MRWVVPTVIVVLAGCLGAKDPSQNPIGDAVESVSLDFSWAPKEPRVGQPVLFTAVVGDDGSSDLSGLLWEVDGQELTTGAELRHTFLSPGPHKVSIGIGRTASVSHVVPVLPRPGSVGAPPIDEAAVEPTIIAKLTPFGASFILAGAPDQADVVWDFGDGNVSTTTSPSHYYARPGIYAVEATIQVGLAVATVATEVQVVSESPRFGLHTVGFEGGEPTVGVTSSGCIFFQADETVARSCDEGSNWEKVNGPLNSPNSRDPFLWVDPMTDRIFSTHLEPNGECIWIAWSDDDGESWLANPLDCGPVPFADHQKLVTGPRVGPVAMAPNPLYETSVYLCFNHAAVSVGLGFGIHCYVSFDGGMTFPLLSPVKNGSGLHGSIHVGPDGTLYVPARTSPVTIYSSSDGALTWESQEIGAASGVQEPTKDPELAVDEQDRLFVTWVGADDLLRVAASPDGGQTWGADATVSTDVRSAAFPAIQAGGGVVAVGFLGSTDFAGNPQDAPPGAEWHLYVAWSDDATDLSPHYFVQRVTNDPVQIGPICMTTCEDGSRNLLDFIDINVDLQGRLYLAFADGCVDSCVKNPASENSRTAFGVTARQMNGPLLAP